MKTNSNYTRGRHLCPVLCLFYGSSLHLLSVPAASAMPHSRLPATDLVAAYIRGVLGDKKRSTVKTVTGTNLVLFMMMMIWLR